MPPEAARVHRARVLKIADVAVWYGERGGGITTYLDAKAEFAARTRAFEHHLVVPGPRDVSRGTRHEVRALRVATANGYHIPLRTSSLSQALRAVAPDVVLVHDRFWSLMAAGPVAADLRTPVVAVHHASAALEAASVPGPRGAYGKVFRSWERRAYGRVDAVMSATRDAEVGERPLLPLRFGLDPAFQPQDDVIRGNHVLYVGRMAREKGIDALLEAAAASFDPWRLVLLGDGPSRGWVEGLVSRQGLTSRVSMAGYVDDREQLARTYAAASCVVVPGAHETFGLVALEAAASGAQVVAAQQTPAAITAGPELVTTFEPGDPGSLLGAIEQARWAPRDLAAAARLAARSSWDRAFEAELADLEQLLG